MRSERKVPAGKEGLVTVEFSFHARCDLIANFATRHRPHGAIDPDAELDDALG
jgi:hypothetical protein